LAEADFLLTALALAAALAVALVVCVDFAVGFLTATRTVRADCAAAAFAFAGAFAFAAAVFATALAAFFAGAALAEVRFTFARAEAARGGVARAFLTLGSFPRFVDLLRAAVDFAAFAFAWTVLVFGVLAIFLTEDIRGALLFGSALETEHSSCGEGEPAARKALPALARTDRLKPLRRSSASGGASLKLTARRPKEKEFPPPKLPCARRLIPDDLNLTVS